MGYVTNIDIKELKLRIPKSDFPMKSVTIIGHKYPKIVYFEDEGAEEHVEGFDEGDNIIFNKCGISGWENLHTEWFNDLEEACEKYGGTLIAECVGEDDEVTHIRIREGVRKKVKIIEED